MTAIIFTRAGQPQHVISRIPVNGATLFLSEATTTYYNAIATICTIIAGSSTMLILLRKKLTRSPSVIRKTDENVWENENIKKAKSFIEDNYSDESLTRNKVSEYIGLAPCYFSYFFKKKTGISFSVYLTQVRMENAKKLLLTTNKTISEIAYHSGFNSPSYFGHLFKKKELMRPTEYRQKYANSSKSN